MSEHLDDLTYNYIAELSERGIKYLDDCNFNAAINCFSEALNLLPQPLEKWEASSWLLGALGDAYFLNGKSQKALEPLLTAMNCINGVGNPFLHLRLGQVQLDLGNDILAVDELTRDYMGAGKDIFEGEDPRYFNLVKSKIVKPLTGW